MVFACGFLLLFFELLLYRLGQATQLAKPSRHAKHPLLGLFGRLSGLPYLCCILFSFLALLLALVVSLSSASFFVDFFFLDSFPSLEESRHTEAGGEGEFNKQTAE